MRTDNVLEYHRSLPKDHLMHCSAVRIPEPLDTEGIGIDG